MGRYWGDSLVVMAIFLKKQAKPKLYVKKYWKSFSTNPLLGTGIDVKEMPDSHICCVNCSKPFFEVFVDSANHKIQIACLSCGWDTKLLFPFDTDIKGRIADGKFQCFRHQEIKDGMIPAFVLLKNTDVFAIGCQHCATEVILDLRTKSNIILAN